MLADSYTNAGLGDDVAEQALVVGAPGPDRP